MLAYKSLLRGGDALRQEIPTLFGRDVDDADAVALPLDEAEVGHA